MPWGRRIPERRSSNPSYLTVREEYSDSGVLAESKDDSAARKRAYRWGARADAGTPSERPWGTTDLDGVLLLNGDLNIESLVSRLACVR
jgi:hypothetical protein